MIVVAYGIAVLLPFLFLYLIYAQDLYGQGKFRFVLLAFGWGLAAYGLAYVANTAIYRPLESEFGRVQGYALLTVFFAPIVEEILKSGILVGVLARRMTYFVDGAIYGFAAGIGFSVLENVVNLSREASGSAWLLAFLRTISTCLMHGSASALVGTAIGRFRYGRGGHRLLSAAAGWALAIGLHMIFNRVVSGRPGLATLLGTIGLGAGGLVLIVLFIRWGLAEEKRWIEETMDIGVGVTHGEKAMVRQYDRIDDLLAPIIERFGDEKAEQVESFVLKQAQLGIKRKARSMSQGTREQEGLDAEIARLHTEMEALRKRVGVYCMSYVRTIFPEDALAMYTMLERLLPPDALPAGDGILHRGLAAKIEQAEQQAGPPDQDQSPAARGGLWDRLDV